MLRVAVLSVHTCPLAPLGGWETGGMNVYVRELCRGLSRPA
jgi:D-inositol-3-phosphate glycosyltransferase